MSFGVVLSNLKSDGSLWDFSKLSLCFGVQADQACTLYDCFLSIILKKQARDSKSRIANQPKTLIGAKCL